MGHIKLWGMVKLYDEVRQIDPYGISLHPPDSPDNSPRLSEDEKQFINAYKELVIRAGRHGVETQLEDLFSAANDNEVLMSSPIKKLSPNVLNRIFKQK